MRIRDWRIAFAVLLVCGFVELSWGGPCPLLTHADYNDQREFQNVCQNIAAPVIGTETVKVATISSATISTLTVTKCAGCFTGDFIKNQNTLQSGATAYPDFLYVGTSATVSGPMTIGSSLIVNGTLQYSTIVSGQASIPSVNPSPGTSFMGCISTITITAPLAMQFRLDAMFDIGNTGCVNGASTQPSVWILQDSSFLSGENSTTPRYKFWQIGGNDENITLMDILPQVSAGTHTYCIGFIETIVGCGSFWVNQTMVGSNWIIKSQ